MRPSNKECRSTSRGPYRWSARSRSRVTSMQSAGEGDRFISSPRQRKRFGRVSAAYRSSSYLKGSADGDDVIADDGIAITPIVGVDPGTRKCGFAVVAV